MHDDTSRLEICVAIADVEAIAAAGLDLMPLRGTSKIPYEKAWRDKDYGNFDAADWLSQGRNVGVRLRRGEAAIDVDPRNGGDLAALLKRFPTLSTAPRVATGGGGWHVFLRVPRGLRLRGHLPEFVGVDIKQFGGFVVAAGSQHPQTGRRYRVENAFGKNMPAPSARLLDLMRRPLFAPSADAVGAISTEDLRDLLAVLSANDFGTGGVHHDEWLQIAMACHQATNGEGLEVWLDWCATDPNYGDEARELNENRWVSFDASEVGGVTVRTLFRAVSRAGHPTLVARVGRSAANDFVDEGVAVLVHPGAVSEA